MEKEKKNKIALWVTIIAILLIVGFYIYKYTNLPKAIADKINGTGSYNAGGGFIGDYGDEINTDTVLKFGDKSNNVVRLQSAINDIIDKYQYSISKLSTDGVFGAKTAAALKFISNNTLSSGNVTVNKVYNLQNIIGAVAPPVTTVAPAISPLATPSYTGAKVVGKTTLPAYLFQ